jgi:ABC-type Fe3+/spermidine/putrescine transport system ATPase subunit
MRTPRAIAMKSTKSNSPSGKRPRVDPMTIATEAEKLISVGKTFSIRPEKIRISANAIAAENGEAYSAQGVIRDVIYLGMHTRYLVTLDSGMDMIVVQQNLETNSDETVGSRGSRVNLVWDKQHIRYLSV